MPGHFINTTLNSTKQGSRGEVFLIGQKLALDVTCYQWTFHTSCVLVLEKKSLCDLFLLEVFHFRDKNNSSQRNPEIKTPCQNFTSQRNRTKNKKRPKTIEERNFMSSQRTFYFQSKLTKKRVCNQCTGMTCFQKNKSFYKGTRHIVKPHLIWSCYLLLASFADLLEPKKQIWPLLSEICLSTLLKKKIFPKKI